MSVVSHQVILSRPAFVCKVMDPKGGEPEPCGTVLVPFWLIFTCECPDSEQILCRSIGNWSDSDFEGGRRGGDETSRNKIAIVIIYTTS